MVGRSVDSKWCTRSNGRINLWLCVAVKRKTRKKVDAEDNWLKYFQSIQSVCPWSLPAYKSGLIDITHWQRTVLPLANCTARVYVHTVTPGTLRTIHNGLNDTTEYEWLWSHPDCGGHSAPMPCLIQQDKQQLERIRRALQT